ncbi:MAG: alpha-hydroxy-acid oxidizing protein [Xanthomonadales bacterium]|nr:alpha-hydroxy-acid oxidizing protein [Xanthomonadales bacterium]NIN58994.1 alpha-hydroxy-acid oxidizing protein [Xanthomonadales bacterium]NIN74327.1 alpha-hydroxy-acid oxidizing protein [Xanthomonadales bacterium]NIO13148.1 alpha-hydroxy-acid oxidizing protein [Xanthomonadales bacterium]NIP11387.1 alpha-hydroxy-acid oxidizing protein [Xanthomonadales bacterium]
MGKLDQALNIEDLRRLAARRLPAPLFNYIEGGADDESNVIGNTRAFERARLLPEYLVDVKSIDLRTRVLGRDIAMPLFLSPTGMSRLFHPQGEMAVARAASAAGTYYTLSTLGTTRIEEVGAVAEGPKCFQIYVMKDRDLTREFIQRCRQAGFDALALTVDVPAPSKRERELRYGFTLPPRINLRGLLGFARRPAWVAGYLRAPPVRLENVVHRIAQGSSDASSLMQYIADQFDPSVTWDDMAWMIEEWGGPFAIKGILSPRDARRAADLGATAIMVSNHGGRQLDGGVPVFDALGPVVDAVGGECEIICDGGIRRGTHVLKALARGATACMMGRPYLYGLAAAGEAGVAHALALLRDELERGMALLGCRSVSEIDRRHMTGC